MASAPDMMKSELSLELLSALSGDSLTLTGTMGMSVGAARLAHLGDMSVPLMTTGILELERPELPCTTGTLRWSEALCLSTMPESPDVLFEVVKLALSDNVSDKRCKRATRNGDALGST